MNAYTSMGQARIQPRDISSVLRANQLAGAPLAVFERQRGCQAEAELNWLLKRNGATSNASASRVALVRQTVGTALVRVGERITGISPEWSIAGVGLGGGPVRDGRLTAAQHRRRRAMTPLGDCLRIDRSYPDSKQNVVRENKPTSRCRPASPESLQRRACSPTRASRARRSWSPVRWS